MIVLERRNLRARSGSSAGVRAVGMFGVSHRVPGLRPTSTDCRAKGNCPGHDMHFARFSCPALRSLPFGRSWLAIACVTRAPGIDLWQAVPGSWRKPED